MSWPDTSFMLVLFGNNTLGTITSGGTDAPASGTTETWTLAAGATGFQGPSVGTSGYHIADPAAPTEKILVTELTGTGPYTIYVTRGDEGTTPVEHSSSGFQVQQVITAGDLEQLIQAAVMTTLGDVLYGGSGGAATRLAGNTAATRKFLRQLGTGSASAAPVWDTLQATDIPSLSYVPASEVGAASGVASLNSSGIVPASELPASLGLLASTGTAGFALENGTPTILSWTPPADGNLHRFMVFATLRVTAAATGGQVNFIFTDPGGTGASQTAFAGGKAAGADGVIANTYLAEAGTEVSLVQQTAMTAGAATVYAELWGC